MFRTTPKVFHQATLQVQKRTTHQQDTPRTLLTHELRGVQRNAHLLEHLNDNDRNAHLLEQLTKIKTIHIKPANDWTQEHVQKSFRMEQSIHNTSAREAAHTQLLILNLDNTIKILGKYNLFKKNPTLLSCVKDHHREFLKDAIRRRYTSLEVAEKVIICSSLESEAVEKLGLKIDADMHSPVHDKRSTLPKEFLLNENEHFALSDYVNSESGIFNAVNGAIRAKVNYGEPTFEWMLAPVKDAIISALKKLEQNPDFALQNCILRKGMNPSGPAAIHDQLYLKDRQTSKKPLVFPGVISATSDPNMSYAITKHDLGYCVELVFQGVNGVKVDLFHDVYSAGQAEVIIQLGLKFFIVRKETEQHNDNGRSSEIVRYYLERVPEIRS